MNDLEKQIALAILQAFVTYGPTVAAKVAELFYKPAPTLDDWNAVFVLAKNPIARLDNQGNIVVPPVGL